MSTMSVRFRVRRARPGMTLLELVVVMGILAALAGLLVPKLGGILTQTGYATAASSSGDVASNLGVYYTTNAAYPANLDSLLEAASTSTLYAPVWNGPTVNGTFMDPLYTVGQPFSSGAYYMSFARAFGTTTTVMDQTASVTDPSMSGTTQRTILGTSADNFAVVNGTATTNSMTHQTTVPAIAVADRIPQRRSHRNDTHCDGGRTGVCCDWQHHGDRAAVLHPVGQHHLLAVYSHLRPLLERQPGDVADSRGQPGERRG